MNEHYTILYRIYSVNNDRNTCLIDKQVNLFGIIVLVLPRISLKQNGPSCIISMHITLRPA